VVIVALSAIPRKDLAEYEAQPKYEARDLQCRVIAEGDLRGKI